MFRCCFFLSFLQREISAVSWPIAAKLYHMIGNGGAILKTRSRIWESSPKKIWGPKNMLLWRDFGRLRTSIAIVSGMEQDIYNRKTAKLQSLPRLLT